MLTRARGPLLDANVARTIDDGLATWRVIEPSASDVIRAIDLSVRLNVSLWDAVILTAARKAGAAVVWTEDLNHGQV